MHRAIWSPVFINISSLLVSLFDSDILFERWYDPLEKANILNAHFATVGYKTASNMPNSNRWFSQYLPVTGYNGSFLFEPVLTEEIELELMLIPVR